MNGMFLEKPGLLKEALKREDEWSRAVPGYDGTMSRHNRPMTSLERSLYKLNAVRELGEWANEFIDLDAVVEDDGVSFEEKMTELSQVLYRQIEESEKLDARIAGNLEALGYAR